jgi:tetratricopeptide (TPR) repeat protein
MSIVYYNTGYCFIKLEQIDNATKSFLKSADFAKKADAKVLEAFALKGLADTYKLEKKYSESLKLLAEAENLSEKIGDLTLNEELYKVTSENYLALQNIQEYQVYNQKYLNTQFKRKQSELNSINQSIDNQTAENKKQTESIKLKYQKLNIFLAFLSLILCLGFLFLILKTRKTKTALRKQFRDMTLD